MLQTAVEAVQNSQPVSHSLEELYRAVEDLCAIHLQDSVLTKVR